LRPVNRSNQPIDVCATPRSQIFGIWHDAVKHCKKASRDPKSAPWTDLCMSQAVAYVKANQIDRSFIIDWVNQYRYDECSLRLVIALGQRRAFLRRLYAGVFFVQALATIALRAASFWCPRHWGPSSEPPNFLSRLRRCQGYAPLPRRATDGVVYNFSTAGCFLVHHYFSIIRKRFVVAAPCCRSKFAMNPSPDRCAMRCMPPAPSTLTRASRCGAMPVTAATTARRLLHNEWYQRYARRPRAERRLCTRRVN
jgi:hypothetical protein